jgi:hypothetical protein
MGHTIRWDNDDKTVLIHEYVAPASKADLYELAEESAAILNKLNYEVHLIIDQRKFALMYDAADYTFLNKMRPINEGTVMLVVSPFKVKFAASFQELGRKIGQKTFVHAYSVDSIEEARRFLQEKHRVRYP